MRKHSLCPICGSPAHLSMVSDRSGSRKEYKANCDGSAFHVACGDWFSSKEKAWADWEKRCTGYGQPEWYHPTNREILARDIWTASKSAESNDSFAKLIKETVKKFDGMSEEDISEFLDLRHDYGFCANCSQYGQEFCICNRVEYQKIKEKEDESETQ